ncbi:signal peptide peptidase SppA [Candidatus Woesearchaeota archaeon]|nr:signal peptide peptidase SppA [Candidatus Woesearchaeota archaeon]
MNSNIKINSGNKWIFLTLFLALLAIFSNIGAWFISKDLSGGYNVDGNIAVIPLSGLILTEPSNSFLGDEVTASNDVLKYIDMANKNSNIKAILFEINSPGGSPVASKEIADAIQRSKKKTYSLIRDVGTSGAYWIASATNKIIANEMSITGSIGVISSYIDFSGLLNNYNVTYNRLVAGKYKDVGSPFKKLEYDEKLLIEKQLTLIHGYFISAVAKNRNLSESEVRNIATGMYFIGVEAKKLGLIDVLGDKYTLEKLLKEELNVSSISYNYYSKSKSIFDIFSKTFAEQSFYIGKGIGSQFAHESLYSDSIVRT